jgi:hypothetical protein
VSGRVNDVEAATAAAGEAIKQSVGVEARLSGDRVRHTRARKQRHGHRQTLHRHWCFFVCVFLSTIRVWEERPFNFEATQAHT